MKNTTRPQKKRNCPDKRTRWSYFMQAIEPTSEAINKAFPGYHPQWVQLSQKMTIGPENFVMLRLVLGMSPEQCAAYLRVSSKKIYEWEHGLADIPFAAFELLRVVLESVNFKISHPEWNGWFMSDKGELVSPEEGNRCYTPNDLKLLTMTIAKSSRLASEVQRLQNSLDLAVEENTKLRQMFLSQGVVDELYSMHGRLSELVEKMATARIFPFQKEEQTEPMEKVA